ncbi:MAG: EF-hand domain-containing protein [Planctomycetota bacterium]
MAKSVKLNEPDVRSPINTEKVADSDPVLPLSERVSQLTNPDALIRMQAANVLSADLESGVVEVLTFLTNGLVEAVVKEAILIWLKTTDIPDLSQGLQTELRTCLANLLSTATPEVRRHAAENFYRFGPDEQRTRFLLSITDEQKRVRWAVVNYFGEKPNEVNRTQRLILVGFLDAGKREDFNLLDTNNDSAITRREWKQDDDSFKRFDKNGDGDIKLDEWINPYSAVIRADVYALLLRLHAAQSPKEKPFGYNPYADATDQLEAVQIWRTWASQ